MRKRKSRKVRIRPRFWIFLILIVLLAAGAASFVISLFSEGVNFDGDSKKPKILLAKKEPIDLEMVCVGDIMVHKPQIASQYDSNTKTYNYENNFQYIKPYIEKADLALCNVETTFAGGTPRGYPTFNAPDELANAIKKAGFDVAITSNNHLYDSGHKGLLRTLEILRNEGMKTAGTRLPDEENYTIKKVKDVNVGIVAYTYRTPASGGRPTINSFTLSEESDALINSFGTETFDDDMEKLKNTISDAKKAGAEIIVCYFHWGEEYQREPNKWQREVANAAVSAGADVIFASHPHVLQPIVETEEGVPIFYSMGNFLSNQREETLKNRYTEQGMIARVRITFDPNEQKIKSIKTDAMGTWMEKYRANGKDNYYIIPLDENLDSNEKLKASGHYSRAKRAKEDIISLIGEEYYWI